MMGMRGFEEARERRKEIGGTERGSKGCEKDHEEEMGCVPGAGWDLPERDGVRPEAPGG